MRLPPIIAREIERAGVAYRVEPGKGHVKLFVCDRLAGVLSSSQSDRDRRASFNVRAQVRKIIGTVGKDT